VIKTIVSLLMFSAAWLTSVPAWAGSTLDNLQTAFSGESNAKMKYEAFATKADAEGYHQVASLFRAAARAEGIHLANHGKVIGGMGASPFAMITLPQVKKTKENLQAALKGEEYERLTMYPEFIKQAELEKNPKAVQTFRYALEAESMHAKYFQEALGNLRKWRTGTKAFRVCSNCGYTTMDGSIQQCPVCSYPREKIFEVK
jgi:rubrerythrin